MKRYPKGPIGQNAFDSKSLPMNLIKENVLDVLRTALNNPEHHFFGITGDVDDLGVFVAQHGRAHAENLVEFIGVLTENYFMNWRDRNETAISSFVFVPGGEEMLLLGTCTESQPLRELFMTCRQSMNQTLHGHRFFPVDDISISFGCAIFRHEDLMPRIQRLLNGYEEVSMKYRAYIEVMYILRRVLAVCLDLEKFRMFEGPKPEHAIAFRNIVHFDLLRHKDRSRNLIALAARDIESPKYADLLQHVCDDYGMLNNRMYATTSLVEALEYASRTE